MCFKRSGCAVAVLENGGGGGVCVGGLYVFGGFSGSQAIPYVEVLSFGGGGWREVSMMQSARYSAAALALPGSGAIPDAGEGGGRVAVFGGFDGEKILSSVEIFTAEGDAACSGGLGRWIHGVDMPKARMACAYCAYRGRAVLLGGKISRKYSI